MLFGASGLVALGSIALPGPLPSGPLAVLGTVVLATAALVRLMPWERWPTWATVVLVVPAFGLIGAAGAIGLVPNRAYSIMFVVVFAWIGAHHPPRTAWLIAPVATVAYAVPLVVTHAKPRLDAQTLLMVIVACVFVAEAIARGAERGRRVEREMRLLADNTTDVIVRCGVDGIIRYASPSVTQTLGWRPDELVGHSVVEGCHPEDLSPAAAVGAAPSGSPVTVTRRLLRADGTYCWVESVSRVVLGPDGDLEVQSSIRDITERRADQRALLDSESRYRQLVNNIPDSMVIVVDRDLRIVTAGGALLVRTGYDPGALTGQPLDRIVAPVDLETLRPRYLAAFDGCSDQFEFTGSRGTLSVVDITPIVEVDGTIDRVLAVARDISALKKAETAARRAEETYRAAFESAPVAMAQLSENGRFLRVNPALCDLLGYSADQLLATTTMALTHPDDVRESAQNIDAHARGELAINVAEKRFIHADGHAVWVTINSVPILHADGGFDFLLSHYLDDTHRKEFEARLEHLASHDPLTDLPNRYLLADRLSVALARGARSAVPVALLFIDLDGFKRINDTFGHEAGDALLAEVARRLKDMARAADTVARLGGDEFVILLDDIPQIGALAVSERMHAALVAPYRLGGHEVQIGASIGIALSAPGMTAEELLAAADRSMYLVKSDHKRRPSRART